MDWIIDRLKERSTWMGLIGLISAAGVAIKPELQEAIISVGLSLVALVAVVTKDLKKTDVEDAAAKAVVENIPDKKSSGK